MSQILEEKPVRGSAAFLGLAERLQRERDVLILDRTVPSESHYQQDSKAFAEHVNASLREQREQMGIRKPAAFPAGSVRDFGGLGSQAQLDLHLAERGYSALHRAPITFQYTIPQGNHIFAPPYDLEWQIGSGLAFGARADGHVITFNTDGESAAGVGFYITSPVDAFAAVTPAGTYGFSWFSLEDLPSAQSRGGLSSALFADGQLIHRNDAQIWNLQGVSKFTGQNLDGQIATAHSPYSGGFGPVPIAPVFINMTAGRRYLVWFWAWQINHVPAHSAFLATQQMTMPFVTIDAGPPIIIK